MIWQIASQNCKFRASFDPITETVNYCYVPRHPFKMKTCNKTDCPFVIDCPSCEGSGLRKYKGRDFYGIYYECHGNCGCDNGKAFDMESYYNHK